MGMIWLFNGLVYNGEKSCNDLRKRFSYRQNLKDITNPDNSSSLVGSLHNPGFNVLSLLFRSVDQYWIKFH